MNLIRESIPHSGSIKRKTITKLFDRFMNRGAEFWNNKEITQCVVQQEANAVSLAQELYWYIDWCLIQFWLHYFGCTVICID